MSKENCSGGGVEWGPANSHEGMIDGSTATISEHREDKSEIRIRKWVKNVSNPVCAIYAARMSGLDGANKQIYTTAEGRTVKLAHQHSRAEMLTGRKAKVDLYYARYEEEIFDVVASPVGLSFKQVVTIGTGGNRTYYHNDVDALGLKISVTTAKKGFEPNDYLDMVGTTNTGNVEINTVPPDSYFATENAVVIDGGMMENTLRFDGVAVNGRLNPNADKPEQDIWLITWNFTYTPERVIKKDGESKWSDGGWVHQWPTSNEDPGKFEEVRLYRQGFGVGFGVLGDVNEDS